MSIDSKEQRSPSRGGYRRNLLSFSSPLGADFAQNPASTTFLSIDKHESLEGFRGAGDPR
jgi:hypothetical protein